MDKMEVHIDVGREEYKGTECVQVAVVLREPGSPLPHASGEEFGLREGQHPAPSHTAIEPGIPPPSLCLATWEE